MAKKKSEVSWGIENTDVLMDSIFDEARSLFGSENFYTGVESEQLIVGLPLPALCLRYLFQSSVFPLSRMTIITGQEGSCKSAMLYEVFRWHRQNGGRNILLECESKDSPELRASIIEYDQKAVAVKPCASLEEWQTALTRLIEINQSKMTGSKSAPGPGRIIPFCFGVDSLAARASEENLAKINKEGFSGRAHPIEALKISQYMKSLPQKLFGWPFSLLASNHLKPNFDFLGRPGRNLPGGIALRFAETFEIEMSRLKDVHFSSFDGIEIQFLMRKNSLGPSRKKIKATMAWWTEFFDPADPAAEKYLPYVGERQDESAPFAIQQTMWNWASASIDLLLEVQSKDPTRWKKIETYLDLHPERGKTNQVWSTALGIPPTDKLSYREAGELLETRKDILSHIHGLLGIRERYVFEPGRDFKEQLDRAKKTDSKVSLTDNSEEMEPLESDPLEATDSE